MRMVLLSFILAVFPTSVLGQQSTDDANSLVAEIARSLVENPAKRGVVAYKMPAFRVLLTADQELNASASPGLHTIFIPIEMVNFLKADKGEIAFLLAHELGHIQNDAECRQQWARLRPVDLQRQCEAAADFIGIQYMMAAGYNPFDAAALMGRFAMLHGNQSTVMGMIVGRLTSNHPVDLDRMRQMGEYARTVCQTRPELCPH